ncbi:MAG: hypothetical protein N2595_01530 [bacterium]|nr:hypothetical protein [bacterium]
MAWEHMMCTRALTVGVIGAISTVLVNGCASFDARVKHAQTKIEESFQTLGYTPRDAVMFRTTPREMKGRRWVERTVRFRDKMDRSWQELHQFFRRNPAYDFEYYLTVGESESDVEKIRWFEFKIDQVFCVYRVEFMRSRLAGMVNEPAAAQPVLQRVPQTESTTVP